ncbi:MAG TPA: DUF4256 domain-containing protein, partial [Verrucomicrobiae bacterium]|nr:DUF4256 domain-containing protein [Verrucomicrobiae bacterium]
MSDTQGQKKLLTPKQREELLGKLKARFAKHGNRHGNIEWEQVRARLEANAAKLWSLSE